MDPKTLIPLILQVALILMIGSVGLRAKWRDVLAAIGNAQGLLRAVIAVNVVVPLVAVGMCMVLPIDPAIKFAIVIMAVSPLAPLVPGKLLKAGMEASRAAGLYAVLIAMAVVIVPLTIGLLNQLVGSEVTVPVRSIATLVAVSVVAPLAAGMLLAVAAPKLASRLAEPFNLVGTVALGLIVLAVIVTQAGQIVGLFGDGTVLAMAVTAAAAIAGGHLLGGPDTLNRKSLALAAATRHPGIAALIIKANFEGDRRLMLVIILFMLTSVLVSAAYQYWAKQRDRRKALGALAI